MGTAERRSVEELLAAEAARQCVVRERWARDTGDWEEMAQCYYEDTRIAVGWTVGSGTEFIENTKKLAGSRRGHGLHQLGPIQVQVTGNRAFAELPAQIVVPVEIDHHELILLVWERMCFRVEKRADDWRIAEFRAVYLKDCLISDRIGDRVHLEVERLKECRESYRYLQYWAGQAGWGNYPDLPGIDRPELMQEVYRSNETWLRAAAVTAPDGRRTR